MTNHLSWETLNDLADGRVAASERVEADAHLQACEACSETLDALRSTVALVRSELPRDVALPDELWTSVRDTIDARKVAPLAGRGGQVMRGWWMTPRRLAAAAAVLIVVSSATTALLLRTARSTAAVLAPSAGVGALYPVAWQMAEHGYLASVEELRGQLEAERSRLSPATVAQVERALATIDVAIAEAREALLQDPANAALSELLASNYRQKVELLRRATQLGSST